MFTRDKVFTFQMPYTETGMAKVLVVAGSYEEALDKLEEDDTYSITTSPHDFEMEIDNAELRYEEDFVI